MTRRGNSDLVDVEYDRIKIDDERYKAILFQFGRKEVWLPRRFIEVDPDAETVACPEWLAQEKGII